MESDDEMDTFEDAYDILDYKEDEEKEIMLNTRIEVDKEIYEKDSFTPKQLASMYKRISSSFVFTRVNQGSKLFEYFCFIKKNQKIALPTLLWLDTFHDFKDERISDKTVDRNKIIDYLCYKLYGNKHWQDLPDEDSIHRYEDIEVNVGHMYNLDKLYQNSFFKFKDNIKRKGKGTEINRDVEDFHPDVKHTVLKDCLKYKDREYLSKLLYDVSNILISESEGFESDILNAYLMVNFNFDTKNIKNMLNQLKHVAWTQISDNHIEYYSKDVDKGSGNFLKGTQVILPASLFDANTSNSSKDSEDFVNIKKTIIPMCNGYDFVYDFTSGCNFVLKYSDKNKEYSLTKNVNCGTKEEGDKKLKIRGYNEKTNEYLINSFEGKKDSTSFKWQKPNKFNIKTLEDIVESSIKELSKMVVNIYSKNEKGKFIEKELIKLSEIDLYSTKNVVDLKTKIGVSPKQITNQIITMLAKKVMQKEKYDVKSPILSCKELDFWLSLKRIGDFGQIVQCKQLNIPLFTNDQMQILISLASCSSVLWTIDNTKIIWYNGDTDSIMCNDIASNIYNRSLCNIPRQNLETYSNVIDELLGFSKDNNFNVIKNNEALLKKTAEHINSSDIYEKLSKIDISSCKSN